MGMELISGINDFFRESLRTSFKGRTILMLGKQGMPYNKADLYVYAKRMGVEFDYGLLQEDRIQGGGGQLFLF